MALQGCLILTSFALIALNIGLALYNYRLLRQYLRLNALLGEVVRKAWLYQRVAPIWRLYEQPKPQHIDKGPHFK